MFHLIGINQHIASPRTHFLHYGNRVIDRRLNKALNWYRNNYYYINSNHVLYRLMRSFGLPDYLPDDGIVNYIENRAFLHANGFGFNSSRAIGSLFYGNFYGPNTTEIITMVDQSWDWDFIKQNWRDLSPVIVLRHDQNHVSFGLQTSKNYTERKGLAIIQVDINLLYLQYYAWRRYHKRVKLVNPDHVVPNIGYFLGMVVLPNMLESHLNQVITNKHVQLTDLEMSNTIDYNPTSFYINTETRALDKDIEEIFNKCKKNNYDIYQYCNNIVGIGEVLGSEYLDTPRVYLTKYNRWVYLLAISRVLRHCLLIPREDKRLVNRTYISRLCYELQYLRDGKFFNNRNIDTLKDYWVEEIQYLFNITWKG